VSNAVAPVQETSYYPLGSPTISALGTTTLPNKRLYNGGSEWQNDFNTLPDYDQTFYRNYDPEIGRFVAVDPEAESSESMTTYQYANNNLVMFNDPNGDITQDQFNHAIDILNDPNNKYGGTVGDLGDEDFTSADEEWNFIQYNIYSSPLVGGGSLASNANVSYKDAFRAYDQNAVLGKPGYSFIEQTNPYANGMSVLLPLITVNRIQASFLIVMPLICF